MNIIEKNANGTIVTDASTILGQKRILFLEGTITSDTAQEFVKSLMYFEITNPHEPVKVFINSAGGEMHAGMMIYDAIQGSNINIELYCMEQASSMAAIIFASGTHGRYILPHSRVMIHDPYVMDSGIGKASSLKKLTEKLEDAKKNMDNLLSKHIGRTVEEVEAATAETTFYSAEEAVEFGLADRIMTFKEMMERRMM